VKFAKEGTENSSFWFALGGKQSYTSKKVAQEIVRDPHLFTFSFDKEGKFEVEEVHNFSQDDLLTEDVLILDAHAEVFVWVGQSVDSKEKQSAFEIGLKYIDVAASLDGLSPYVPLYKVTEGNEPCFFTSYFSWDPAKATAHGNSFQKKAMLLLGAGHAVESPDKSNGSSQGGPTQRASALAALSTAFKPSSGTRSGGTPRSSGTSQGSQRAAAVAALSQVLTAEKKRSPESSPARSNRSPPSEASPPAGTKSENALSEVANSAEDSEVKDTVADETLLESNGNDLESKQEAEQDENGSETNQSTFSYEQLKAHSENPVTGIDFKRREAYLSDEEFQTVFRVTKEAFYKLPKWKQDMQKKKFDLF